MMLIKRTFPLNDRHTGFGRLFVDLLHYTITNTSSAAAAAATVAVALC